MAELDRRLERLSYRHVLVDDPGPAECKLLGLLRNAPAMVAVGALAYLFMFRGPASQRL